MEKILKNIFWLSLVGGLLVLISGFFISFVVIAFSFLTPIFGRFSNTLIILLSLVPIVLGGLMIKESFYLKNKLERSSCVRLLVYSIISLILALGFIVGPLIGVIGSVVGLKTKTQ